MEQSDSKYQLTIFNPNMKSTDHKPVNDAYQRLEIERL